MIYPSFEEAEKILASGDYKIIPISRELYSDCITPIEVMRILKNVSKHCYMLESVDSSQKWGRYTFLGYDPTLEVTCYDHLLRIRSGMTMEKKVEHPKDAIREILKDYKSPKLSHLPSFTGGLVGYFSYDYIKYSEPGLVLNAEDEEKFKDVDLMLFDKVIAFDHFRQKIILIVNAKAEFFETEYNKAVNELDNMAKLIRHGKPVENKSLQIKNGFQPLFTKEEYCGMVEKAKHYIREGDIFQVVLSNRLEAEIGGSLFDTYRVLRTLNPSPYMFYFPVMMWKLPEHLRRHWSNWKMESYIPILLQEPGQEEKPRKRIRDWKKSFLRMKKNGRNTICWWILEEMTLAGSVR